MLGRERRQGVLLERYWQALATDRDAAAPRSLLPDMAETSFELARAADRLRPNAARIAASRRRVVTHALETAARRDWSGPAPDTSRHRVRTASRVEAEVQSERMLHSPAEPIVDRPCQLPRELLKLVAAALIFVVIGGLLALMLRGGRSSQVGEPGNGTPLPINVTPTATPSPVWDVSATIPVGSGGFHSIASGAGSIWVTNTMEGTVWRIDPRTNTVIATIQAGDPALSSGRPNVNGIVARADAVWVARTIAGDVVRIDPATNEITTTIDIGGSPTEVDTGHGSIWVIGDGNSVSRVDPATNAVVATIEINARPVSLGASDSGVWIVAQPERAWWEPTLLRIDPATNRVAETIQLNTWGGGIVADGTGVWLHSTSSVLRFEQGSQSPATTLPIPGSLTGGIATDGQALWATLTDRIVRIDPASNTIAATVDISDTTGIVSHIRSITITGQTVWVVTQDDRVIRIDPTS